jgi:coiled-coil-helix-coiled-coil-helix domain-containing protein 10
MSGLMGSVVSGMAMGTGSAIAHRAVDSVMGPRQMEVVHKDAPAAAGWTSLH